jgi:hypothetical protein
MTMLKMQEQVISGGRVIVPVVREKGFTIGGGVFAGVDPVALLVGECGKWFFVAIEEGFDPCEITELLEAEAVIEGKQERWDR